MKIRKTLVAVLTAGVLTATAACGAVSETVASTTSAVSSATDADVPRGGTRGGGPGADVELTDVSSEDQLVTLLEEAYGDGGLDLHRGHQPVQDVLDEVLGISHEELHVRMEEQGQNLAAVAEDLGVDPQELVDALVEAWTPAITSAEENGVITSAEAEAYTTALEEAFTFRVTWDGEEQMPTVTAVDA